MQQLIEFVSPAGFNGVRNRKMARYLKSQGFQLSFVGWDRSHKQEKSEYFSDIEYVLKGGGESNKWTPLFYCFFIFKLITKYLFSPTACKSKLFFAVNFEAAFSLWVVSHFRNVKYIYDIWDELALSHNFPKPVKKLIRWFDKRVRKSSQFYIHVDPNRVSEIDSPNYIIIYNTPYDFYKGITPDYEYEKNYAVTGYFSNVRGLESIYQFAKESQDYKFIVVGEFLNKDTEKKFLELKNVDYHHFMPQEHLFEMISKCRGIFSLYDPSLEINQLAASNKLYDAMMLGIPVIVNNGIKVAQNVKEKCTGSIVDYVYNSSWNCLNAYSDEEIKEMGRNGRAIFMKDLEFSKMCDKVLLPTINKIFHR